MAHYAFIDENNLVVTVLTGVDETELIEGLDPEIWYANKKGLVCKRTSYNGNIRKNYAGIGYKYDEIRDAFIPPKPPYESWLLDENTCQWVAPIPKPSEGIYYWSEQTLEWINATEL